jgi:hypothetical protein
MGQARDRGTFGQRKAQSIAAQQWQEAMRAKHRREEATLVGPDPRPAQGPRHGKPRRRVIYPTLICMAVAATLPPRSR